MSSSLETRVTRLERENAALATRLATLEGGRPGRKPKPIVVSAEGVCGIDPDRDSDTCPDASLYRYQMGCRGERCSTINTDYYGERRKAKK